MIILTLIAFTSITIQSINAKNADALKENFGPYSVAWKDATLCTGKKRANLTETSIDFKRKGEDSDIFVNITFLQQTKIDVLTISMYQTNNATKNFLYNYKYNNPCKNSIFEDQLKNILNATNCVVNKGSYPHEVNLSGRLLTIFGPTFFYGEYVTKTMAYSKKGNIICLLATFVISKKA